MAGRPSDLGDQAPVQWEASGGWSEGHTCRRRNPLPLGLQALEGRAHSLRLQKLWWPDTKGPPVHDSVNVQCPEERTPQRQGRWQSARGWGRGRRSRCLMPTGRKCPGTGH